MKVKPIAAVLIICLVFGGIGYLGYRKIRTLKQETTKNKAKIQSLQQELAAKQAEVENLRDRTRRLENKLAAARTELQKLRGGNRFDLHNPTYREAKQFIKNDETDEKEYKKGEFVCVDFAASFNRNAEKQGIRCAIAHIRFDNGAHAIAAFKTVDRGLIYVEPQNDIIMPDLEPGQEYWDVVNRNSPPGLKFEEAKGDTIQRIVIVW